jgi:hypothetical protein
MVLLEEHGHTVFPVHPSLGEVEGRKVYASLGDIPETIDTVTVYLSARNSNPLTEDLRAMQPRRIIFNPGAENEELAETLRADGVDVVEGCTLVMLKTGQF